MQAKGKKRYIIGIIIVIICLIFCVEKLSHMEEHTSQKNDTQEEPSSQADKDSETESSSQVDKDSEAEQTSQAEEDSEAEQTSQADKDSQPDIIDPAGNTLQTRIHTPAGFTRQEVAEESLEAFLRNYTMKADGEKVLLYNGKEKGNQSAHAAVFALPIENADLQQCADSVMRVYAEYYWSIGAYDKIKFHFTNGFLAEYEKWREGYRIVVDGNDVSWSKSASYDDSYESFVKYLRVVFSYAGTLSMESEATKISLEEAKAGDVFLQGGSPGHVVMIVDVCVNEEGKKAFLLAQGYMPAQEFHVLKNDLHEEDPWYYEEEITYPLFTPEYTFQEGSLKTLY